jgi:hypothetical protein
MFMLAVVFTGKFRTSHLTSCRGEVGVEKQVGLFGLAGEQVQGWWWAQKQWVFPMSLFSHQQLQCVASLWTQEEMLSKESGHGGNPSSCGWRRSYYEELRVPQMNLCVLTQFSQTCNGIFFSFWNLEWYF